MSCEQLLKDIKNELIRLNQKNEVIKNNSSMLTNIITKISKILGVR